MAFIIPNNPFVPKAFLERIQENNSLSFLLNFYPSWDDFDEELIGITSEIIFLCDRVKLEFISYFFQILFIDLFIFLNLKLRESCKIGSFFFCSISSTKLHT